MQLATKIKTNSVQAADLIREAIFSGELKQGMKLREVELSKLIGTSRSPIREAYRILESEGLIRIEPNKGAYITKLTAQDLDEIYELRVLLEAYAVRIACAKMNEENLEELKISLQKMETLIKRKEYVGYLKASYAFHESYLEKCKNEKLINLYRILKNNILAVQMLAYSYPKHSIDSLEEHRSILSALLMRDAKKAEECVTNHLRKGYERAKEFLKD